MSDYTLQDLLTARVLVDSFVVEDSLPIWVPILAVQAVPIDQAIQNPGFRRSQGLLIHLDIGVQYGQLTAPVTSRSEQIYEPSLVLADLVASFVRR
jgi:hypothetical protein